MGQLGGVRGGRDTGHPPMNVYRILESKLQHSVT